MGSSWWGCASKKDRELLLLLSGSLSAPSHHGEQREKGAVCNEEDTPHHEPRLPAPWPWDFTAYRTVRNKCVWFKPPSVRHSGGAAWAETVSPDALEIFYYFSVICNLITPPKAATWDFFRMHFPLIWTSGKLLSRAAVSTCFISQALWYYSL